jgi:hypothetical protein
MAGLMSVVIILGYHAIFMRVDDEDQEERKPLYNTSAWDDEDDAEGK